MIGRATFRAESIRALINEAEATAIVAEIFVNRWDILPQYTKTGFVFCKIAFDSNILFTESELENRSVLGLAVDKTC